jgi:hypothetical protein
LKPKQIKLIHIVYNKIKYNNVYATKHNRKSGYYYGKNGTSFHVPLDSDAVVPSIIVCCRPGWANVSLTILRIEIEDIVETKAKRDRDKGDSPKSYK